MNSSSSNVSTVYRDSSETAVVKNVIIVVLGITINFINGTLVHTFRKHPIFYLNPRYILYIHLVANDMIQLTTSVTLFVLSYFPNKVNAAFCCFMVSIAVFTTLNTPLNLTLMAAECYIAVCFPLRHAELCTLRRTYILIGWIWVTSIVYNLIDVCILLVTEPVQFFYSNILCYPDGLFRHPVSSLKRDISYPVYLVGVWLTLFYTYFKIFFAAKAAEGDARKARNTILLHGFQLLLSMLTYIYPILTRALVYRFPKHFVQVLFVLYIVIQMLPRIISPIVYGLRDKTFKLYLKRNLLCPTTTDKL